MRVLTKIGRVVDLLYAHTGIRSITGIPSIFWKKNITSFWQENCDRRYMKSTIYPTVGTYLKDSKTKRVLDIGVKWYDIDNRDYFYNNDIIYWVIDVSRKPIFLKCEHFLRVSILDLPYIYSDLKGYFDVVISYGVLGFYKFDKKSVEKYLQSVHEVLKPNGIFLLKLDIYLIERFEEEFRIEFDVIHKYFASSDLAGLPEEKKVCDGKVCYAFYTLRKKCARKSRVNS